jgi:hypothetical protein
VVLIPREGIAALGAQGVGKVDSRLAFSHPS